MSSPKRPPKESSQTTHVTENYFLHFLEPLDNFGTIHSYRSFVAHFHHLDLFFRSKKVRLQPEAYSHLPKDSQKKFKSEMTSKSCEVIVMLQFVKFGRSFNFRSLGFYISALEHASIAIGLICAPT